MSVALLDHFASLKDPRVERTKLHALSDIVALTICGVICGADGWDDIHFYACSLESWYRTFLPLTHGIPSSDTIRRVMSAIRPDAFQACFLSWVQSITEKIPGSIIALDGKTVRGAQGPDDATSMLHVVSAWSHAQHLVLAEQKVDRKSNEITAIPKLLQLLELEHCIVTIDAIGCQKAIVRDIVKAKAGYAIVVKANQEHLHRAIVATFQAADPKTTAGQMSCATYENNAHGRYERRTYHITNDLSRLPHRNDWEGLTHIGAVTCERYIQDTYQQETRYYILCLVTTVEKFAEASRGHWGIENNVHWILDVTFHEDALRVYDERGAQNLATTRKIALNMLKQEKTKKLSIKNKRALCAMNSEYLKKVLSCVTTKDNVEIERI
jgi:predicted transposase YbfD/YdcC